LILKRYFLVSKFAFKFNFLLLYSEDVAALAHDLQPDVVFLDFDRTLCTTRGGAVQVESSLPIA
jgi:hypothetical protein